MTSWLYLIAGGMIGTVARHCLSSVTKNIFSSQFPYGTLLVNLLGCFIIGFTSTFQAQKILLNPNLKLFFVVGFCGAFTTLSAIIFETDNLVRDGEFLKAFLNIFLSVLVGFLIFRIGAYLGKI